MFVRGVEQGGGVSLGFGATGGSSPMVMQTRLAAALTRDGYEVLEAGDVERLASDEETENPTERTLLRLSRSAGADAILIGLAESGSQTKVGFFGIGAGVEEGIVSASVKVVDAESGRTVAILTADYEEPKTANEVIDALMPLLSKTITGDAEELQEKEEGIL